MNQETTCETCGRVLLSVGVETTCPQCSAASSQPSGFSASSPDETIDLPSDQTDPSITLASRDGATIGGEPPHDSADSAPEPDDWATLNEVDDLEATSWGVSGALGDAASLTNRRFGDYDVEHEVARGGMGVVYRARQRSLNRVVALKMIRAGELAGVDEVKRFRLEAEAAAALNHPCIVPIYDVGELKGQHYYSMGYVEGQSLSDVLNDGPLPPSDAAHLVALVADAMDYAHSKGVIHRDLKPGNILLADHNSDSRASSVSERSTQRLVSSSRTSPGGEATFHWQPRITDFGLAKQTQSDSELTSTGQVLGTPSYMPPEQARGEVDIGPAADVYSLGAVLYATLVARPPFQSASVLETIKQVIEQDPVPPSRFNPAIPKDIDNICLKCLEKAPNRRYESAAALADDLCAFVEGRPVQARPVGATERFWRWCRRKPMAATALFAGAITVVTLVVLTLVTSQLRLAKEHSERLAKEHELAIEKSARLEKDSQLRKQQLQAAEERAAAQRKIAATQEYFAIVSQVRERNTLGDMGWAYAGIEDLRRASELPVENRDMVALRSTAVRCLTGIDAKVVAEVPLPNGYRTHRIAVSPKNDRFAVATNKNRFQLYVCVCEFPTGKRTHELRVLPRSVVKYDGIRHVVFLDDGDTLGVVTRTGYLHRWDLTQENPDPVTVEVPFKVDQRIAFDEPRSRAFLEHDGKVHLWGDFDKPAVHVFYEKGVSRVWDVSPDGKMLVVKVDGKSELKVLDTETKEELFRHEAAHGQFDTHGRLLAYDGTRLQLLDAAHGRVLRSYDDPSSQDLHEGVFRTMDVSADGALAVTSAADQVLKIWDLASGNLALTIPVGDEDEIWPRFVGSNHLVANGGKKGLVYELNGPGMLDSVAVYRQLHSFDVSTVPFRYVTGGAGLPKPPTQATPVRPGGPIGPPTQATPVRPGRPIGPPTQATPVRPGRPIGPPTQATPVRPGGIVELWDGVQRLATWRLDGGRFFPEVSVDRRVQSIVVGMYEGERIWGWTRDAGEEETFSEVESREFTDPSVAIAMDKGCWIVEDDHQLVWRDLPRFKEQWRWSNKLASHIYGQGTIRGVAVAKDRVVAVAKTGHLLDLDFQQREEHSSTIVSGASAVAVRWRGDLAVYGTQAGELGVVPLNRSDEKPPPPIRGHRGYVASIAIAPNQNWVASSSRDRTIRLWELKTDGLRPLLTIQLPVAAPRIRFTPDGDLAALLYKHNGLRVWRLPLLRERLQSMGLDWSH